MYTYEAIALPSCISLSWSRPLSDERVLHISSGIVSEMALICTWSRFCGGERLGGRRLGGIVSVTAPPLASRQDQHFQYPLPPQPSRVRDAIQDASLGSDGDPEEPRTKSRGKITAGRPSQNYEMLHFQSSLAAAFRSFPPSSEALPCFMTSDPRLSFEFYRAGARSGDL